MTSCARTSKDDIYSGITGSDSLLGSDGNDTISGGGTIKSAMCFLSWSQQTQISPNIAGGFTQNTGGINVAVSYRDLGQGTGFAASRTSSSYVALGESFSSPPASMLAATGGSGCSSHVTMDFSAVSGSGFEDEVTDVSFRLRDVDKSTWTDIITVSAYDADGNEIAVTLGAIRNDVPGQTVNGIGGCNTSAKAEAGVLVTVAGPVSRIEITYANDGSGGRVAQISDVHFTAAMMDAETLIGFDGNSTAPTDAATNVFYGNDRNDHPEGRVGGDSPCGGRGDDALLGGAGCDDAEGAAGVDAVTGGTDSDTISLYYGEGVDGAEAADDIDTRIINGRAKAIDDASAPEAGTIRSADGSTDTSENIDSLVYVPCFASGVMIETAIGSVPVQEILVGDRVLTRDSGYRAVCWIGRRHVDREWLARAPHLHPVLIRAGALGQERPARDMMVSPQHRMLLNGARAEMLFGEREVLVAALHLVGLPGIDRAQADEVTYVQLLFDAHEIVLSDGCWSETYQPGDRTLAGLASEQRREILALFPELATGDRCRRWIAARRSLHSHEARVLLSR